MNANADLESDSGISVDPRGLAFRRLPEGLIRLYRSVIVEKRTEKVDCRGRITDVPDSRIPDPCRSGQSVASVSGTSGYDGSAARRFQPVFPSLPSVAICS